MRFLKSLFLSVLLVASAVHCADATFSAAAPATVPAVTIQVPASATVTTPAAPTWLDTILTLMAGPYGITIIVWVVIRSEAFIQSKTKLDMSKINGAVHAVFNGLFDIGLIKNGKFKVAEDAFWDQFDTQYRSVTGTLPTENTQTIAHAQFVQLFTQHTDDVIPPQPGAGNGITAEQVSSIVEAQNKALIESLKK